MNVNIMPGLGIKQKINVSQYDVGRAITINLLNGYDPYYPPTDATAVVHGTKPSGLGFSVPCTFSGSTAAFETTAEMTAESGMIDAELSIEIPIYDTTGGAISVIGTRTIGTANFFLCIEKSPHPAGTVDGTTADVVNAIEAARDAAIEDIQSLMISAVDDGNGNIILSTGGTI